MTREEAQQAWEKMRSEIDETNWLFVGTINPQMVDMAIEALQADTVEVVRCKDCKYWQDNNDGYPHPDCRWTRIETPDADDYCSLGERSE